MCHARFVSLLALNSAFCLSLAGCGGSATTASIDGSSDEYPATAERTPFDDEHPAVIIRTTLGDISVDLDRENAPIAVDNFLAYVSRHHYDETIFHMVEAGYVAIGGGYDAKLQSRGAEFPVRNEAHHSMKNLRGTIAMARSPDIIDSATDQFFFNLADNSNLDHRDRTANGYGYCAFGKVSAGADVLDKIGAVTVEEHSGDFTKLPTTPIVIKSVQRVR